MHPTRLLARPMLASVFVVSGIDVLRNPAPRVAKAEPVVPDLAARFGLPGDTELLVRVNAATQVVAGAMLSMGKLRRLSAAALIASLVPSTYVGHRFWEEEQPEEKAAQRLHFLKNLAVLGGLVLELVDTEGRPSLGWRSQRAARRAAQAAMAGGAMARGSKTAVRGVAVIKGVGAVRDAASGRLGPGVADAASRARGVAESAMSSKVIADTAARSRELAAAVAKANALHGVTDLARDFDITAARELAGKAARSKVVRAASGRG